MTSLVLRPAQFEVLDMLHAPGFSGRLSCVRLTFPPAVRWFALPAYGGSGVPLPTLTLNRLHTRGFFRMLRDENGRLVQSGYNTTIYVLSPLAVRAYQAALKKQSRAKAKKATQEAQEAQGAQNAGPATIP